MKNKIWNNPIFYIFLFFGAIVVFDFIPLLYTIAISFTDASAINTGSWSFVWLDNFRRVFSDTRFLTSWRNTLLLCFMFIPVSITLGLIISMFLYNKYVKFRHFFQIILLIPYIIPTVVLSIMFIVIFDPNFGIVNQLLPIDINWFNNPNAARVLTALILIWKYTGFNIILFSSVLSSIPPHIIEAAHIDGAGIFKTTLHIKLPFLKNIIFYAIVINFINGLFVVEEPMLLFSGWLSGLRIVGGPQRSVLTLMWYLLDTAFGTTMNYGKAGAISTIKILSISFVVILANKLRKRDNL